MSFVGFQLKQIRKLKMQREMRREEGNKKKKKGSQLQSRWKRRQPRYGDSDQTKWKRVRDAGDLGNGYGRKGEGKG